MPTYAEMRAVLMSTDRWRRSQRRTRAVGALAGVRPRPVPSAEDGSLMIPAELATRWTNQIATPYVELSESEKESDREQVQHFLAIILEAIAPGR